MSATGSHRNKPQCPAQHHEVVLPQKRSQNYAYPATQLFSHPTSVGCACTHDPELVIPPPSASNLLSREVELIMVPTSHYEAAVHFLLWVSVFSSPWAV